MGSFKVGGDLGVRRAQEIKEEEEGNRVEQGLVGGEGRVHGCFPFFC